MHADLIAIRAGLSQLQSAGIRMIDCHHFGLSASEPLTKISAMAEEWKQPFQREYTERSVSQAFDKLLGLRADVEQALEKALGKAGEVAIQPSQAHASKTLPALKKPAPIPTGSNTNAKT